MPFGQSLAEFYGLFLLHLALAQQRLILAVGQEDSHSWIVVKHLHMTFCVAAWLLMPWGLSHKGEGLKRDPRGNHIAFHSLGLAVKSHSELPWCYSLFFVTNTKPYLGERGGKVDFMFYGGIRIWVWPLERNRIGTIGHFACLKPKSGSLKRKNRVDRYWVGKVRFCHVLYT